MNNIQDSQLLLYQWLCRFDNRRIELIKSACIYLSERNGNELEMSVNSIFYPLLRSGVVDNIGDGRYSVSPSTIIYNKKNVILVNLQASPEILPGIAISDNPKSWIERFSEVTSYKWNAISVLKNMPTLESVTMSFYRVPCSSNFAFDRNNNKMIGIGTIGSIKHVKYFANRKKNLIFQIPSHSENPDALNIAYCYERICNQINNGIYDKTHNILKMKRFAIPYCIYRILMITSFLNTNTLNEDKNFFYFSGISKGIYTQLNRIYINSIILE